MLQLSIFEAGTFLDRQIIIMYCIFKYHTVLNAINKYLLSDISISYQEAFAV